MRRSGFTLVELLASIIILGAIVAIITPMISKNVSNSKEKALKEIKQNIVEVAKKEYLKNTELLPTEHNKKSCMILQNMINKKLFDTNVIIDPVTNASMYGSVVVSYNKYEDEYSYNYVEGYICEE